MKKSLRNKLFFFITLVFIASIRTTHAQRKTDHYKWFFTRYDFDVSVIENESKRDIQEFQTIIDVIKGYLEILRGINKVLGYSLIVTSENTIDDSDVLNDKVIVICDKETSFIDG